MDALLTIEDVMYLTQLSRTKIYDMVKVGEFPRQRRISHRVARWSKVEIEAWLQKVVVS